MLRWALSFKKFLTRVGSIHRPAGGEIKKELTALETLKLDIEQFERMRDGVNQLNEHVATLKAAFARRVVFLLFAFLHAGPWTLTRKPS